MASDDSSIDARESIRSRYDLHYELLGDRARLSGAFKASLVARFGHFGLLFGFFFAVIIAPSTLADVQLFDYKGLFDSGGAPGYLLIAGFLLIDYTGRLLVRGMRYSLCRQLREGTDVVDDWPDHLRNSAARLPRTALVEWLTVLAALLGVGLLLLPGLWVLYVAGPVTHYVVARDTSFVDGIKRGIAFAHRHRSELLPRFLVQFGWRFFLLLALGAGFYLMNLYASMYLPLTILLVAVLAIGIRPFILHFGLMRDVAFTSTLQQLDGELELAKD